MACASGWNNVSRVLLAAGLALASASAAADISSARAPSTARSTQGAIVEIAPPRSVYPARLVSADEIKMFAEQRDAVAADAIAADITEPTSATRPDELTPGTVRGGRRMVSFILHADASSLPPEIAARGVLEGTVRFASPILGVMLSDPALSESDPTLGAPETDYPSGLETRGLELDGTDRAALSDDRLELSVRFDVRNGPDQLRIVMMVADDPDVPWDPAIDGFAGDAWRGGDGGGGAPPLAMKPRYGSNAPVMRGPSERPDQGDSLIPDFSGEDDPADTDPIPDPDFTPDAQDIDTPPTPPQQEGTFRDPSRDIMSPPDKTKTPPDWTPLPPPAPPPTIPAPGAIVLGAAAGLVIAARRR